MISFSRLNSFFFLLNFRPWTGLKRFLPVCYLEGCRSDFQMSPTYWNQPWIIQVEWHNFGCPFWWRCESSHFYSAVCWVCPDVEWLKLENRLGILWIGRSKLVKLYLKSKNRTENCLPTTGANAQKEDFHRNQTAERIEPIEHINLHFKGLYKP